VSEDDDGTMTIVQRVGRGSRRRFYTSPVPPAVLQSGGAAVWRCPPAGLQRGGAAVWRCCRAAAARTVPAAAAVTVAALQGRSWPCVSRTFGGAKLTAEPRMCGAQQPRICGKRKLQIRRAHVGPTRREA